MKNLLLLILVIATSFVQAQLTSHNVSINGVNRHYYQYLPVNYQASENLPVVLILHGLGDNAQNMTTAGFNFIADTARVIAIYPDALMNALNQQAWNNGTLLSSTADDIGYFNYLLDDMILNKNADPSRIYCTGFSMGSIMSYHVACAMNSRIAAIGCMAGTMSTSDIQNCNPVYKTPVIHLHGTADAVVPYNSNPFPSLSLVPETMDFWENVHSCSGTPDSIAIPNTAADNITVDRFVYDNCSSEGPLELWRLNGAEHVYLYKPLNDITEAVEVWLFFRRFQHSAPAQAGLNTVEATNHFSVYPNPGNGDLKVNSLQNDSFSIYDVNGKLLLTKELTAGSNDLDLKGLDNGIYYIQDGQNTASQKFVIQK